MIPLALFPWGSIMKVAGVAAAIGAGWWVIDSTIDSIENQGYRRGVAEVRQRWDHDIASRALAELAETNRRASAQQEIARHADEQIAQARAAADAADTAAAGLRKRAAELAARCDSGQRAAPPESGASVAGPGLVLANVLGRSDDTSGELAEAFDQARARGLACERAYDALSR